MLCLRRRSVILMSVSKNSSTKDLVPGCVSLAFHWHLTPSQCKSVSIWVLSIWRDPPHPVYNYNPPYYHNNHATSDQNSHCCQCTFIGSNCDGANSAIRPMTLLLKQIISGPFPLNPIRLNHLPFNTSAPELL